MQAYFGGTFVDGTGAVVGVGLIRNLAPLMAGLTMAGLIAARTTTELRGRSRARLDVDPLLDPRPRRGPRRAARVRSSSAHAVAGTAGGRPDRRPRRSRDRSWRSGACWSAPWSAGRSPRTMLGVSTHGFFSMMWEMLWLRDVTGMIVKGLSTRCSPRCSPATRGCGATASPRPTPRSLARPSSGPSAWPGVAILIVNSGWFLLVYHAGPAFGPTSARPQGGLT